MSSATSGSLLTWLARHGAGTAEDLAVRFELGHRQMTTALCGMESEGLVRRAGVLVAEPELYVSTAAGLRASGIAGVRLCAATPRAEGHLRAVSAVAVWLECELGSRCDVLNERELARGATGHERVRGAGRPYVSFAGGMYKRPDLLIRPRSASDGGPVAVEVELSRKSRAHIEAICMAWSRCRSVAGVLYMVAPGLVAPINDAIHGTGADERVTVLELAAADVPALRRREMYVGRSARRIDAAAPDRRSASVAPEVAEVVAWVARMGAVSADSVAVHCATNLEDAGLRLAAAERLGLLQSALLLRGEGPIAWATRKGLRSAGLSQLPACPISYASAARLLLQARVAAVLERERGGVRVVSARQLGCRVGTDLDRGAAGFVARMHGTGLGGLRRPSLVLLDRDGALTIVLIETASIDARRLRWAIDAWRAETDARLLVFAPSRAIGRRSGWDAGDGAVELRPLPCGPIPAPVSWR